MKKLISLLLALTMMLALAACGDTSPAADPAPSVEGSASAEPEATVEPEASAEPEAPAESEQPSEPETSAEPETEQPAPEETHDLASMGLSEILAAIQNEVPDLPGVGDIPLDSENFAYYMFIDPVEGAEAMASEAMIGSIAHSIVLLKAPDGADVEAIAQSVRDNANPRKWICVEAEKCEVVVKDNFVLLVMTNSAAADAIIANFNAL